MLRVTRQIPDARALPFQDESVFCFTSDLEWTPEWAVSELFNFFDEARVPVTPFLTHDSNVVRERFDVEGKRAKVGLHPNFLPSSTHGATPLEVIDYVQRLWPEAISFRAHNFFDNTHITDEFCRRGFRYDSNLCLFLQPNCVPLWHNSGMLRFPVFWEDDIHFSKDLSFDLHVIEAHLQGPGLKLFNVHPLHFALNTPNRAYYAANKHLYNNHDAQAWRDFVFPGRGTRTFVEDLINHVKSSSYKTAYLHDLFLQISKEAEPKKMGAMESRVKNTQTKGQQEDTLVFYQSLSNDARSDFVRRVYDARDGLQIYSTSRDFNLRELEISFIAKHLVTGRVLDIGCGNGYTLLCLARKYKADFLGLDFSPNMVESARKLTEKFAAELRSIPEFRVCDIRSLPFGDDSFDSIISERCLLNLPSREDQYRTIREVHRVLRHGGVYLMVEGTEDGLSRLNQVRERLGLNAIPSAAQDNASSLKFHENEIERYLEQMFEIQVTQFFGTYYLISRVVHPLLVYPETPRFDAQINVIARKVAEVIPDVGNLGHMMGYKLVARKNNRNIPR
jgi:ubiquinone/menaquinone biosynthesis C-methylase UbiE